MRRAPANFDPFSLGLMVIWSAAALILLIVLSVQLWRCLRKRAVAFIVLLVGVTLLGWWRLHGTMPSPASMSRQAAPVPDLSGANYITSRSCRKCHADHYESWYATYHRTMTREATPEYVKGDFSGKEIQIAGLPVTFFRNGDRFYMKTVDPQWAERAKTPNSAGTSAAQRKQPPQVVFPVDRVVGSHIAQAYLTRGPLDTGARSSGVYLVLPYHYSLLDHRWITRIGSFLQPPPGELFAQTHVWNDVCIYCHNVKPRPRKFLADTDRYFSAPAELGIACESCHGPGERHAAANRDPLRRLASDSENHDPTIVNPAKLDAAAASAVCGRCHSKAGPKDEATSRRIQLAGEDPYTPGDRLDKWFGLPMPDNDFPAGSPRGNLFWPDGTPLAAGLEYQGLLLSPCYRQGRGDRQMSCLSCHSLHESQPVDQLKAGMRTNAACYRCHEDKRATLAEHTHHSPDSSGSLCYNCHMPNVVYGLLGVHRSHRVISPGVKSTLETGLPNACNLCHLDQTLAWTNKQMAQWYGHNDLSPKLDPDNKTIASSLVLLLRGDAVQRAVAANAFWRAATDEIEPGLPASAEANSAQPPTTASTDSSQTPDAAPHGPEHLQWSVPFLVDLLGDPYAAVRLQAHRALRTITGREDDYFYLDPPAKRQAASKAILAAWLSDFTTRSAKQPQPIPVAVPLGSDGRPDETTMLRLRHTRDDREVAIDE